MPTLMHATTPEMRGFVSLVEPVKALLRSIEHPSAALRVRHLQTVQVIGISKEGAPENRVRCLLRFEDGVELAVLNHWIETADGSFRVR